MSSIPKKSFFFYELNLLNLPLAFSLKLFGNVFILKHKGKCQRFLFGTKFPSINDFSDIDQWVSQKEIASKNIQDNFSQINFTANSLKVKNLHVNLKNSQSQHFCIAYEQYVVFSKLVDNHPGKKYIVDYSFRTYLKKKLPHLLIYEKNVYVLPFSILDNFYAAFVIFQDILKIFYRLFISSPHKKLKTSYKYVCAGISASEFPKSDKELNFSWLVTNKILLPEEVLYILNAPPSQEEAAYLLSKNIQFVTKSGLFATFSVTIKFKIILDILIFSLKNIFFLNFENKNKFYAFIEIRCWLEVFLKTSPSFYINSFSAGWPETYEILICKTLKIKSIIWFYSAGEFLYSENYSAFTDQSTRFCIFEADEIWVWNDLVKDLIGSRLLVKDSLDKIKVMGSILNGDWNALYHRFKKSENITIAAFDLTPMKVRVRLSDGEGPYANVDLQEKFYQGILKIHEAFPNINLLIKTKRHADPSVYELVPTLKKLITLQSDRISFPSSLANPYSIIADADFVISVPFTSPTMMALSFGIKGIYYDPIRIANHTFKNSFKQITVNTEEELISFIENNEFPINHGPIRIISIDEIEKRLKKSLN